MYKTPAVVCTTPAPEIFIDGRAEFSKLYEKREKGKAKEAKRRAAPVRSTNRAGKLDERSYSNGVSGSRRRPQFATTFGNLAFVIDLDQIEMDTIDDLAAALEASAGKESSYPKDGENTDHDYRVGNEISVIMCGTRYEATITQRFHAFDRARYTVEFHLDDGDYRLMITQRQLRSIIAPKVLPNVVPFIITVEPVRKPTAFALPVSDMFLLPAVTATARALAQQVSEACPICFGTGAGRLRMTEDGLVEAPCGACGGLLSE